MDERQRYEQGMKIRRAVLGDAHVNGSLKNRNDFNGDFQDLFTRYAWGDVWSSPSRCRDSHLSSLLLQSTERIKIPSDSHSASFRFPGPQ
jgi:4-carboxymuconolactone decarboxylase